MSMETMSRNTLIVPLECQQSSLVTENNSVMSSLGKLPDFVLHKPHGHRGEEEKYQTLQKKNKKFCSASVLRGSCGT